MSAAATVVSEAIAIRAGVRVDAGAFENIRRRMMLEFFKWDGQIGDVATLADFPLILPRDQWQLLAGYAENAAEELRLAEIELIGRPGLHKSLGLPRAIRAALRRGSRNQVSPAAARVMRFDFHPTSDGWRASEVNSDVPGGFTEATNFTRLMAEECGAPTPGDPMDAWATAIARAAGEDPVALLYAPGYLEDLQIVMYLQAALKKLHVDSYLAKPQQLHFEAGFARLASGEYSGPLGDVVRFIQGEWLARFPGRHWKRLFTGGKTPVANPATALLSESKRFPLVMDALKTPMPVWRAIHPETRDPRDVPWEQDDNWIVKGAFGNTGDAVCLRDLLPAKQWRSTARDVWWRPSNWVAQRRFAAMAIDSPVGEIYPCVGVYTIDGIATGIYGRYATRPLIDFSAVDVAVLLEEST